MTHQIPFYPADILLPMNPTSAWPTIACDQYTAEPAYWEEAWRLVGDSPSTLRITLPEIYLKSPDKEERIAGINRTMQEYLQSGILREYPDAMILTERTLPDGRVRRGIVGAVDLAAYDYTKGAKPMIRATEGTVLERIPPRVAIRRNASLELPHVMLLIDDPIHTVIEPAAEEKGKLLYDLDLMQNGGHVRGYLLDKEAQSRILVALDALVVGDDPMLFAVGDGNHSLATAKACAMNEPNNPLAARALVELVNIHDPSLVFEPIYRVLFHVDPEEVARAADAFFPKEGSAVTMLAGGKQWQFCADGLVCGCVQTFLDRYLSSHPEAEVDYIHGEDVVRRLASEPSTVGFLFQGIEKSELFPYVKEYGALPRKTFSMGEANEKRYYLEARRIKQI